MNLNLDVVKSWTFPITNLPSSSLELPVKIGMAVIVLFFGVGGAWGTFGKLDSAAVAQGVIGIETNRKTIKHLEGGIVRDIVVKEGDHVEAGQLLISLDPTQARARLDLLKGRYAIAIARAARLRAELNGASDIEFPPEFLNADAGSAYIQARDNELAVFQSRIDAMTGQVDVLNQQIAAFESEIDGLNHQVKSQQTQSKLIKVEIKDTQTLFDKGLAQKSRLLALQRSEAEIEGALGQNLADIARIHQNIGETRIRIQELSLTQRNEIAQQLQAAEGEIFDLQEQRRAAEDVLNRSEIYAPITGTVVEQKVHTKGGVVSPGEPLLDIVPEGERLLVDARVNPQDIDVVHVGMEAQVRLTAFNQRNRQPIIGTVVSVSADRLIDETTGGSYFLARVEPKEETLSVLEGADIKPGMQADVYILTGERSPLDYLFSPLTRSVERALREDS